MTPIGYAWSWENILAGNQSVWTIWFFYNCAKLSWRVWGIVIYWRLFILMVEKRAINICSLSKSALEDFLVSSHYLFLGKAINHLFMYFVVICALPGCIRSLLLQNWHKLSSLKIKFMISQFLKITSQDTIWFDSLLKAWMDWNDGVSRTVISIWALGSLSSSLNNDGRVVSLWL